LRDSNPIEEPPVVLLFLYGKERGEKEEEAKRGKRERERGGEGRLPESGSATEDGDYRSIAKSVSSLTT